jgi:hypothetical protein
MRNILLRMQVDLSWFVLSKVTVRDTNNPWPYLDSTAAVCIIVLNAIALQIIGCMEICCSLCSDAVVFVKSNITLLILVTILQSAGTAFCRTQFEFCNLCSLSAQFQWRYLLGISGYVDSSKESFWSWRHKGEEALLEGPVAETIKGQLTVSVQKDTSTCSPNLSSWHSVCAGSAITVMPHKFSWQGATFDLIIARVDPQLQLISEQWVDQFPAILSQTNQSPSKMSSQLCSI